MAETVTKPIALDETLQRVATALESQRKVSDVDNYRPDANGHIGLGAVRNIYGAGRAAPKNSEGTVDIDDIAIARKLTTDSSNSSVSLNTVNGVNDIEGISDAVTMAGSGSHVVKGASSVVAMGADTVTNDGDHQTFVWNGEEESEGYTPESPNYETHGPGTFNINPRGGVDGVFIGNTPLSQLGLGGGSRQFVYKTFNTHGLKIGPLSLDISESNPLTIRSSEVGWNYPMTEDDIEWTFTRMDTPTYANKSYKYDDAYRSALWLCYIEREEWESDEVAYVLAMARFDQDMDHQAWWYPVAAWKSNGEPYDSNYFDVPTDRETMEYPLCPNYNGGDGRSFESYSCDNNLVFSTASNLYNVKLSSVSLPWMVDLGKINICIPVAESYPHYSDPYSPVRNIGGGADIYLPKSTNPLESREAWVIVDLSAYSTWPMEGPKLNINYETHNSIFPMNYHAEHGVYGVRRIYNLSENYSDNEKDVPPDAEHGQSQEAVANMMAFYGRVTALHLLEIAPDMWTVDSHQLSTNIPIPSGGSSSMWSH